MIGQEFAEWVREKIEARHERLIEKQDLNIEIAPEILEVIKDSNAISTQHGNSVHLLKVGSKRRRTRAEIDLHK